MTATSAGPVGFACAWDVPKARTWSGTPARLLAALARRADVVDLGPDPPRIVRAAFKGAYARRREGRWVTAFKWSAGWEAYSDQVIGRAARRAGCTAVVQVQDLGAIAVPYYVWQDLSIAALLELTSTELPAGFEGTSRARLVQRLGRQQRVYDRARGLFPMSRWLARSLEGHGVAPGRMTVIHPGANIVDDDDWPELGAVGERPPHRLLFVGRDFQRKGGDVVVAAFAALRQRRRDLELTVIGPRAWPLADPPPSGVTFLGSQTQAQVLRAMGSHDAFVMPSRFEAFGIAPAEALCCGLPALVRNAFAFPEIVPEDRGVLVNSLEVEELVAGLEALLEPERRERCVRAATQARRHWSWSRAAGEMLAVIARDEQGASGGR